MQRNPRQKVRGRRVHDYACNITKCTKIKWCVVRVVLLGVHTQPWVTSKLLLQLPMLVEDCHCSASPWSWLWYSRLRSPWQMLWWRPAYLVRCPTSVQCCTILTWPPRLSPVQHQDHWCWGNLNINTEIRVKLWLLHSQLLVHEIGTGSTTPNDLHAIEHRNCRPRTDLHTSTIMLVRVHVRIVAIVSYR